MLVGGPMFAVTLSASGEVSQRCGVGAPWGHNRSNFVPIGSVDIKPLCREDWRELWVLVMFARL